MTENSSIKENIIQRLFNSQPIFINFDHQTTHKEVIHKDTKFTFKV